MGGGKKGKGVNAPSVSCRKWKRNGVLHIFVYIQKHNRSRRRRRRRSTRSRTRRRKNIPFIHTLPSISMIW